MRRLRRTTRKQRVRRPTTVHLPAGTHCYDVTAHPVGDRPRRVGVAGLELYDVDKLRCPQYRVDYVGRTAGGRWVAFDLAKSRVE